LRERDIIENNEMSSQRKSRRDLDTSQCQIKFRWMLNYKSMETIDCKGGGKTREIPMLSLSFTFIVHPHILQPRELVLRAYYQGIVEIIHAIVVEEHCNQTTVRLAMLSW